MSRWRTTMEASLPIDTERQLPPWRNWKRGETVYLEDARVNRFTESGVLVDLILKGFVEEASTSFDALEYGTEAFARYLLAQGFDQYPTHVRVEAELIEARGVVA